MENKPKVRTGRLVLAIGLFASTGSLGDISLPDLEEAINGANQSDAGFLDGGPAAHPVDGSAADGMKDGPPDGSSANPETRADAGSATPDPDAGGGVVPELPMFDPLLVERGRKLYGMKCIFCHGADGSGGPVEVPLDKKEALPKLADEIDKTMPKGAPESCDAACAQALAVYIQATFVTQANVTTRD